MVRTPSIAVWLWLATTLLPAASDAIEITQGTLIHCGFAGRCPVDLGSNAPLVGDERGLVLNIALGPLANFPVGRIGIPQGALVDLRGTAVGLDVPGTALIDGDGLVYQTSLSGPPPPWMAVNLFFGGSLVAPTFLGPPVSGAMVTMSTPFEVTGGVAFASSPGSEFSIDLAGFGTAMVVLRFDTISQWSIQGIRYDFSAVPEPSTLLLGATVTALLLGHRIRRQNDQANDYRHPARPWRRSSPARASRS